MSATASVRTSNFRYPKQWIGDAAPNILNDSNNGYGVGDVFTDKTNKRAYICTTSTAGAAVWNPMGVATADTGTAISNAAITVAEQGCEGYHKTTFTFAAYTLALTDATTAGSQGAALLYTFPEGLIRVSGVVVNLAITGDKRTRATPLTTGLTTTAAVVMGIGTATVGTDNATLLTTEANIVPSTACTLGGSVANVGAFVYTSLNNITALTDSSSGSADGTIEACADISTSGGNTYADTAINAKLAILRNWAADFAAKINAMVALQPDRGLSIDGTTTAAKAYLNAAVPDAGSAGDDNLFVTGTIQIMWTNYGDK